MPIVSARRYVDGSPLPEPITLDGTPREGPSNGGFDWIGLTEPGADELALVARQYGLHPLAVEDAFNARQLPKVEIYGDQLFVIARTARLDDDTISYGETAIFMGPGWIITVRHGSARGHTALRRQLEATPGRLTEGVDHVLHAILDFIVDGYFPIIEKVAEEVQLVEEKALDHFPEPLTIRRMFRLRRELGKLERILAPLEDVASRLASFDMPGIDAHMRPYFRDVHDHVRRVIQLAQGQRETLTSIVETSSLMEQHRIGVMTRQLTAWAAILAVPTAIAGLWGMNFASVPGDYLGDWGFWGLVGIIALICGGLWVRFRRLGWL